MNQSHLNRLSLKFTHDSSFLCLNLMEISIWFPQVAGPVGTPWNARPDPSRDHRGDSIGRRRLGETAFGHFAEVGVIASTAAASGCFREFFMRMKEGEKIEAMASGKKKGYGLIWYIVTNLVYDYMTTAWCLNHVFSLPL